MRKRIFAAMLCLALFLGCAGCSIMDGNITTLLKVPNANNMQRQLRSAIDASIGTNIKYISPVSGSIKTSFISVDLEDDGRNEAVIIYSLINSDDGGGVANIAVFAENDDGSWTLIKKAAGLSDSIDYIEFRDFNSDGYKDILVGWIEGDSARELCAYDLKAPTDVVLFADAYNESRLFTDSDGAMFIFTAAYDKVAGSGKAKIMALDESGKLTERASCDIDAHFESIASITYSRVSAALKAVIIDARQGNNAVTQLLFYDGRTLTNPYYENGVVNPAFVRETAFTCMDIDKDGIIEIPSTTALPELSSLASNKSLSVMRLTNWLSFDPASLNDAETSPLAYEFSCVMNGAMKYYYIVPAEWMGKISAYYNSSDYGMTFYSVSAAGGTTQMFTLLRLTQEEYDRRSVAGGWYELRRDGERVYAISIAANLPAELKLMLGGTEDSRGRLILYS